MHWEGTAWRLAALGPRGIGSALKRDWPLGRDWLSALDGLRIQGSSDGLPTTNTTQLLLLDTATLCR